jgi:hypothetical protein
MSIQFRSRIKPAINYAPKLNSYGVCCGIDNSKTIKSFIECFTENGHFVPGASASIESVECPDADLEFGCCCSCSRVTPGELDQIPDLPLQSGQSPYLDSGTQSNITRCECARRGGKWTSGSCPDQLSNTTPNDTNDWRYRCVNAPNDDVRKPKGCCHLKFDEITGWPTGVECTNVCTAIDCERLTTDAYPSVFNENRCGQVNCDTDEGLTRLISPSINYTVNPIGSCYTLNSDNEYDCTITHESMCSGYWVEALDQTNSFCVTTYQPQNPVIVNGIYSRQSMSLSEFNSKGLTSGDKFQGGTYVGIFKPPYLNGKSSIVYGNLNFDTPKMGTVIGDSVGGTDKQWALIVDETLSYLPILKKEEYNTEYRTSLWDGYYNTYGNSSFNGINNALTNTFKYTQRKGFVDYYIPSIYELYFYAAYLYNNGITDKGNLLSSSYFNTNYINKKSSQSSLYNNTFVYSLGISDTYDVNFKTYLVNTYTSQNLLLFRRIVLT